MADKTNPLVLFMPSGKRGRFSVGTPILDAARELGVYVESVCGGRGICGRCQIEIQTGNFAKHGITSAAEHISSHGAKELRYADKRELKSGRRLSCSSTIQGDLVVDIPTDVQVNAQVVRKADDGRHIDRNPAIHLCYVEVAEPDMHNPLGDFDRLKAALKNGWANLMDWDELTIDHHLLTRLQPILRQGKWQVTAAIHKDGHGHGIEHYLRGNQYQVPCTPDASRRVERDLLANPAGFRTVD
jgi:uncharacterized 2Fe-2S/4Fe-4S cluster protein (DUF4445 family)